MEVKNILLTGYQGYVGATLIRFLKSKYPNYRLVGYDTGYFMNDNPGGAPEDLLDVKYFGDIREFEQEILVDENIDTIIYLSAISNDPISNQFEDVTFDINYKAALDLAKKAKKLGVRNFIFASSCSVYGFSEGGEVNEKSITNPLTPYAKSKERTEDKLYNLTDEDFKITCLRFATACGMSDRLRLDLVLNDFVASAYINKKIEILSDGTPWRPLIDTVDMSRAIGWATERQGKDFEIVNVGANDWNFQVKELAELVKEFLPDTEIVINPNGVPDKRSYKVNFDKFAKLAPKFVPQITIQQTIASLILGLDDMDFRDKDFRNSNLIRLNKIINLQKYNLLDNNLKWNFSNGN